MTLHLGDVPASSTLYIPFCSYDSNGASVTLTGLAVTDIEIYKNGSVTQRSSDAGYTLLDTDGIDFDAITGLHGFSVDLSDNTDAGFYAVGSFYWVVVSTVTIDTRTVTFIAATFRIVAAEAVAGKPKVDVDAWLGTAAATPTVAGVPEVDITHIAGSAVSVSTAQLGVNVVNAGGTAWASGSLTSGVFAAGAIDAAAIAANAIGASELAADAVTEIAGAVWDQDATTHQTTGTFGQAIGDPAADTNTIYAAVVTGAAGATIAADIVAVQADTDDIQTRIPAALTAGGNMKVDTLAISGSTEAADRLERTTLSIVTGTVGAGSTTTSIVASATSPVSGVNDQFKGRIMNFDKDTTTVALRSQSTDITAYTHATTTFTVTALTTAPASGDTFTIT